MKNEQEKIKEEYYIWIDEKIQNQKIPLEADDYKFITNMANWWLGKMSSQKQKMREMVKSCPMVTKHYADENSLYIKFSDIKQRLNDF